MAGAGRSATHGAHVRCVWLESSASSRDGASFNMFPGVSAGGVPAALVGIAEVDETMFLLSFKGQRTRCHGRRANAVARPPSAGLSHEQVPVRARDPGRRDGGLCAQVLDAATLAKALKPFVPVDLLVLR